MLSSAKRQRARLAPRANCDSLTLSLFTFFCIQYFAGVRVFVSSAPLRKRNRYVYIWE